MRVRRHGWAVQVDPGFSPQLTPRLLSGTFRGFQLLKLKHSMISYFQTLRALLSTAQPAPLRHGFRRRAAGAVPGAELRGPRVLGVAGLEARHRAAHRVSAW